MITNYIRISHSSHSRMRRMTSSSLYVLLHNLPHCQTASVCPLMHYCSHFLRTQEMIRLPAVRPTSPDTIVSRTAIILCSNACRSDPGLTQPPIRRIPWGLSLVGKKAGCQTDHSPQSLRETKKEWSYASISICPSDVHRDNLVSSQAM